MMDKYCNATRIINSTNKPLMQAFLVATSGEQKPIHIF